MVGFIVLNLVFMSLIGSFESNCKLAKKGMQRFVHGHGIPRIINKVLGKSNPICNDGKYLSNVTQIWDFK